MNDDHPAIDSAAAVSPLKVWIMISGLALTVFIFVTTSLMPMGLLPDIAAGLGRSEAVTGLIVTGYAWVSAALTLPLTMLLARFDRRTLLMAVLMVFILGHLLAARALDFNFMMLARALTALAHAVLWGLATPMAVSLAPEGRSSRALAAMSTGVALSTIVGVPLGTLLGQALGWRAAFLAVGLAGLVLLLVLAVLLPKMPSDNPSPLKNLSLIAGRPRLWLIYSVTALALCGHASAFTYFTPFMRTIGGFSPPDVVNFLLLFGLAGVAGSFLASTLTGRPAGAATALALLILALSLGLANQAAASGPVGAAVLCLIWGAALSGAGILFQSAIFKTAPEATDLGMSLYAVFFNLGIGGGAFIGGRVFEHFSLSAVTPGGAVFQILALLAFALSWRRRGG